MVRLHALGKRTIVTMHASTAVAINACRSSPTMLKDWAAEVWPTGYRWRLRGNSLHCTAGFVRAYVIQATAVHPNLPKWTLH
jgi:hypothetical protein